MTTDLRSGLVSNTDSHLSQYISATQIGLSTAYTFKLNQNIIWPLAYSLPVNDYVIKLIDGDIFDGSGYKIIFGSGNGPNCGIFITDYGNITAGQYPVIKNLTIESTVMAIVNIGGGGFVRNGYYNFIALNCNHVGAINSIYGGGICSQPFAMLTSGTSGYLKIVGCSQTGNIIGSNDGSGGIIGGGILNNSSNRNSPVVTFIIEQCYVKSIANGLNIGGIIGGGDNVGCIGNGFGVQGFVSTGFITINGTIQNCVFEGTLSGKNCGGICGGGDTSVNSSTHGGGCIGNGYDDAKSPSITLNINNCLIKGSIYGRNCAGICAGGDIISAGVFGAGCIANGYNYTNTNTNNNNNQINVNFINCNVEGVIYGNNCGGICAGGDNNGTSSFGAGCISNGYNYHGTSIINIKFDNCKVCALISGNNCGGICAGGDNYKSGGAGCIGNGYVGTDSESMSSSNITINFINCHLEGSLSGNNCGGICAGGENRNGGSYGGGSIANGYTISLSNVNIYASDCSSTEGSITGDNCGGIFGGGNNSGGANYGGGCVGNGYGSIYSDTITFILNKCYTECAISGNNCGGIFGGGDNGGAYGGGCIGNGHNISNNTTNMNITYCYSTKPIIGNNCGGICAGGNNTITGLYGGGCIGNGYNTCESNITMTFTKCYSEGSFNGKDCGGILSGGDDIHEGNIHGNGGGCISIGYTNSSPKINIGLNECYSTGSMSGNNNGGICGGGDFSGCISNNIVNNIASIVNVSVNFNKCYSKGSLTGNNCGGICAGGENAGCIANGNNIYVTSIGATFYKCKSFGTITGDNTGGICGGGNNVQYQMSNIGGGCIGNLNVINSANFLVTVSFTKCSSKTSITGHNSGGICGGGLYETQSIISGNCIGCNNNTVNGSLRSITVNMSECTTKGNIKGIGCGGLCATYIGYNNTYPLNLTITSCKSLGHKIGRKHVPKPIINTYCGGLLAGFVNGSNTVVNTIISNCYTVGYIGSTCGGICGQGDLSTVGQYVNITDCYTSGKKSKYGFYISDPAQNSTISTVYTHETLYMIINKLGQLSKHYWIKHHNKPPTLR